MQGSMEAFTGGVASCCSQFERPPCRNLSVGRQQGCIYARTGRARQKDAQTMGLHQIRISQLKCVYGRLRRRLLCLGLSLPCCCPSGTAAHNCWLLKLQMNKLKKMALMVVGQNLNTDELQGVLMRLCATTDRLSKSHLVTCSKYCDIWQDACAACQAARHVTSSNPTSMECCVCWVSHR